MVVATKVRKLGFGEEIGIITFPPYPALILGHVSNATTYNFPVRFKIVDHSTLKSVITPSPDFTSLPVYVKAAKELEEEGVRAIATNCGFLVLFQEELAKAVDIPVFTSSLMQVPLVHRMLRRNQKVGIMTADSKALTAKHLGCAGIDVSIPIAIAGMENEKEFYATIREKRFGGNFQDVEKEVVKVAKSLISENPEVGAIVLECTELPPYALAIQEATNLPVFDMVTLVNYVYNSVVKKRYVGFV